VKFRVGAIAVGLGYLAVLRATQAADQPVDPALLEFLGSVDTEDKDWHDYLARTDIDQVAKRAGNARGNQTPAAASVPPVNPPPAAASPAAKNPAPSAPANSTPPVAHP
jgi:hypothetical protein